MTVQLLLSAFLLACAASTGYASGYHKASPPDVIELGYPANDVSAGQIVDIGADGAGLEVPGDYYGFIFNTSVAVAFPNGTKTDLVSVGNLLTDDTKQCKGFRSSKQVSDDPSVPLAFAVRLNVTDVGT